MEHIAPLVQTVLWVTLIGVALWRFHRPLYGLLEALQRRVEAGSNIEAGPFKLTDQLKPQDPLTQRRKAALEIAETLEVTNSPDVGAPLDETGRRGAVQAKYFQAEDLVLRAIHAEYGATISTQVTAGSDTGFDGAFVTNGRLNIVEVKFLRGPSGNVSRLKPSVERLINVVVSYGWKNAQIILAVVFEREDQVARATELLKVIISDSPIAIVVRCYSLGELHTWGSALTHHPHVHGIMPGGGLATDGERWVRCRPGFFLPVRVLSRLFRRRFLEELAAAHHGGRLQFFGDDAGLSEPRAFAQWLAPLRECEWVVYAKRPFAGPAAVLAYLSRYTHRVAISNRRLLALDERGVTFRWKDYRATGKTRYRAMTLAADEFMRRFLLPILPGGFHRIRHYGLLANAGRREHLAQARQLLHVVPATVEPPSAAAAPVAIVPPTFVCPHCGAAMSVVEIFARGQPIRAPPAWRVAA